MAQRLGGRPRGRKGPSRRPPPLLFVTDPRRTPDPLRIAERLPPGTGVVWRTFGAPDAARLGAALAKVARRRRLVLLVGADERLAARIGAAGLHLPERALASARRIAARRPGWLLTGAAHSRRALVRARAVGLDAALLSPVFESRSPSAGAPLGPLRFARMVGAAGLPVYALGGVDANSARRLIGSGAAGIAAVEAFVAAETD